MKEFPISVLCGLITLLAAATLVLLAVATIVVCLPLAILEEITRKS